MQKVTVICTGKLKEKFYLDAAAEYAKRLSRFCRLEICELPEERLPENPSAAQIATVVEAEGRRLEEKLPRDGLVIALCIEGKELDSPALAACMQKAAVEGKSHVTLLIGGSYGLSPAIKSRAQLRLSMSPMTFPHQLARVMVLEQIYRAFQIAGGGKYHK